MVIPPGIVRAGAIALGTLAVMSTTPGAAIGQRPGGGGRSPQSSRRPPVLDVTGEKVVKLNPVAKLLKEGKKLALTENQVARIDSINTALLDEIALFVAEIDSLRPRRNEPGGGRGGAGPRGAGGPRGGGEEGGAPPGGFGGRLDRLVDATAQVKLRYDAALLDIARILGDGQRRLATKLVEKGQARMEEYATPPDWRRGG
jgi:hypothetical protein